MRRSTPAMLAVLSSCAVVLLLAANTASAAYPYTATLAPDYTLNWDYDTVKQVISFQMVYTNGTAWLGFGFSPDGPMTGTTDANSNAVICSPGNGTIAQYDLTGITFAEILPQPTAGTGGFSMTASGGMTTCAFTRSFNNGNATDAQVEIGTPTDVIWAVGPSATFEPCFPKMGTLPLVLVK